MEEQYAGKLPGRCPVCRGELVVTRLQCAACGSEVSGTFGLGRLATLREPHASLLEMFLRVRGNVKEMERELGLSYPTVRARLDEAFEAAGYGRGSERAREADDMTVRDLDLEGRIRGLVEGRLADVEQRLTGLRRRPDRAFEERAHTQARSEILDRLERGEIDAGEAQALLRELKNRRES